eukprot:TRINITY_DN2518_c0_g1_i21.p2 TRINITY_DN2518_c0_g1~~TRINITY_DN2518_c0_g1_i21.p2  ORF type:complete len:163 (-),score=38.50 TRINITY_DN2518_c0_g1_i21:46-534(-)
MAKVLVVFYSTYGHIYTLAKAEAEGAKAAGCLVDIKRVPETLPEEVLVKMGAKDAAEQWKDVPFVTADDLKNYDAILFGFPTRFGGMAAQMKTFIDSLGGLWRNDGLVGKLGGIFTSSSLQHGGNELTILSSFVPLYHLGFSLVGLPYTCLLYTSPSPRDQA